MMRWLPKLLSVVFLWALVFYLILFVDPELIRDIGIKGVYLPFLLSLFLAFVYTFSLLFRTVKIGAFLAFLIISLLALQLFRILTLLTLLLSILFTGIVLFRFYSSKRDGLSSH